MRLLALLLATCAAAQDAVPWTLQREGNWLVVQGAELPGGALRINYMEAYCRGNSTDADWVRHTKIPHTTRTLSRSDDGRELKLECTLQDGVRVEHTIRAAPDGIVFELAAHNPTATPSELQWAQCCPRLGPFSGFSAELKGDLDDYLPRCFIFLEGTLRRLPVQPWATTARYTPGQVFRPKHVPASDVNPRPLSALTPSNGLIGCFSADETRLFAIAFEPYQELFQGVARCVHADVRFGGLKPGETKRARGKIYLLKHDVKDLLRRYAADFPEHHAPAKECSN